MGTTGFLQGSKLSGSYPNGTLTRYETDNLLCPAQRIRLVWDTRTITKFVVGGSRVSHHEEVKQANKAQATQG